MDKPDPYTEFLGEVEKLRDEHGVRVSAHTSSVSADAWIDESPAASSDDEDPS